MEKKFEEKFGLKTEEMEEILGGVVAPISDMVASMCSKCVACSSCVSCVTLCMICVISIV
jgi:hypothetical protein